MVIKRLFVITTYLKNLNFYFFVAFIELDMILMLKKMHFEVIISASGPYFQLYHKLV